MEKQTQSKNNLIVIVIILVAVAYYFGTQSKKPYSGSEQKTKIEVTTLQVTKFYNGEEGYSLSIPEANSSTCIWTWVAGSGSIPDSRTTTVNRNATEKHFVMFGDYIDAQWDYKVSCTDDFGNQYVGRFPSSK